MDTTSQERTACRLGTGEGAIIHVIGMLGLLRSLRYEETGNFMKFLVIFFLGSISSIIGDFADWKYLGMPLSFF